MQLTSYLIAEPLGQDKVMVLNCLSGAVDFFEKPTYENLINKKYNRVDNNIIQTLKSRGYLFTDRKQELEALASLFEKYKIGQDDKLVDILVLPTYDCNLACSYCFQKDIERNVYLKNDNINVLLSSINQLASIMTGHKVIQLFGGEPLLPKNKPFVKKVLGFCKKSDYPVAVTSNGTTIGFYEDIIRAYQETIKLFQITIDGPPDIHNKRRVSINKKPTFDLIIAGIKFLSSCKIDVQIRINVDKTNVYSLPELAECLEKRGLLDDKYVKCSIAPVQNHCDKSDTQDLFSECELLERIQTIANQNPKVSVFSTQRVPKTIKHLQSVLNDEYSGPCFSYCEANRDSYYVFAPDGLIYPCSEAAGQKNLAIGHFLPSLKIDAEKLEKWSNRTILTISKCKDCNIAPLCGGGCTYAAYNKNGDVSKPYCHQAQKLVRDYLTKHKFDLYEKASNRSA